MTAIEAQSALSNPVTHLPDRHPVLVYLGSLSAPSRIPQRNALKVIAGIVAPDLDVDQFPWIELRYQHVQVIRTVLVERYSAASANRMLAALRGVLKECWRLGYMSAEEYHRAVDIKRVRGSTVNHAEKGRHLKQGELVALMRACDLNSMTGVRNVAMLALAYSCGLRREELISLDLADYDQTEDTILVRHGKGDKQRQVPVEPNAANALRDWIDIRGQWAGPLFVRIRRGNMPTEQPITGQAFYQITQELAILGGVKNFTPHDLRRTFAGDLLDAGADLATVQKLMGHSNAQTTAGYDRRDSRAKRDAVNKIHFPYRSARSI